MAGACASREKIDNEDGEQQSIQDETGNGLSGMPRIPYLGMPQKALDRPSLTLVAERLLKVERMDK